MVHQQTGHTPTVPLHNIGMLGGSRVLFTQSVPILAAINSVNEAPDALNDYALRSNSGSLAIIRRSPSRVTCTG